MGREPSLFEDFFRGQHYGQRGDFMPRTWHTQCFLDFQSRVKAWRASSAGDQFRYCIYAGTGSGKTQAAAWLASFMLNNKHADQIVLVCPNRSIRRRAREVFRDVFGIDLAIFHTRKHKDGIPRTKQGYILTYAHLDQDPTLHRRICSPDTMVIFDEIHHLGDASGWGESALEAFAKVNFVIALTGTPFRSDNTRIPFVTYDEQATGEVVRFKGDFTYTLGQAIHETICRRPLFQFHDAAVTLRATPESGELTVTFKDTDVTEKVASLRLAHAVRYTSVGRQNMLRVALQRCREEGRKVIVFLGGDTEGDHAPTTDATEFLPAELREMGISDDEFEVITGEDQEAQDKIAKFGASSKWILVSINMVSEGTDIPELSAAIFLTSITAKQTTYQRIGRVLRLMGDSDPFKAALIFMFEDPKLLEIADEIEAELKEFRLAKGKQPSDPTGGNGSGDNRRRAEGYCFDGGKPTVVKFGDSTYPADAVESARQRCRDLNLPSTMLQAVLEIMLRENDGNR